MSIRGKVITTSGLFGSYFRGPIRSYWSGYGQKMIRI